MAKYQAYAEYKDSGVEWLGEIPSHWEMWKLGHAYSEIGSGTTPSTTNEENFEGDIPWVTTGELRENTIFDTKKKVSKKTLELYPTLKKYPVGSVAIAMYGATIGRLGIFGVEATTNQACCVMTISKVLNNDYLFYWLQAFKDEIVQLSSGGGQPNINQEKVASLRISAPNVKDQTQIANFLDHETAKIDHLIEKQQQLIELLKEKRQAVISHAVTKGLDPNVPMKDSGVEWLGEVPEHWNVTCLARISGIKRGSGYQNIEMEVEGQDTIQMLRIADMHEIAPALIVKNTEVIRYLVEEGDILVAGTGATAGISMLVPKECNGWVHSYNSIKVKVDSKKVNSAFLQLFLISDYIKKSLDVSFVGSAQPFVDTNGLGRLRVLLPPLHEQINIYDYLNIKTRKIDLLISKAQSAIQLMQERRTALISATVTGKIDVRNWQSPTVAETHTELSA